MVSMFSKDSHFQVAWESVKSGSKAWGRLLSNLILKACVSVKVSIAVIKHHDQRNWGGKGLFCLYFHITILIKGSEQGPNLGKNLEARAGAEALQECCWLAHSSWLIQPAFLKHPVPPGQEWYHPHGAGPSHINCPLGKRSTGLWISQSYAGSCSNEALSSQMTLVCVKLTKKN